MTKKVYLGNNGYFVAESWDEANDKADSVGDEALVCCDLGYLKSMIKSLES